MYSIEKLFLNEDVQREYKKTLLLNMFKKMVQEMNKEESFRMRIKKLYSQSTNAVETTSIIVQKKFSFSLDDKDSALFHSWLDAYFKKKSGRKAISKEIKLQLIQKQNGICASCGEYLGDNLSRIHVDHIIPWVLVGDELMDNYQVLCEFCNECKSARINFSFMQLIKLD